MENNYVTLVFDYENKINWEIYPESILKIHNNYYIFPKSRFAEMSFIVNDFKKIGKKVTVII